MVKRRKLSFTEKLLFIVPLLGVLLLTAQGPLRNWWNRYGISLPWSHRTVVQNMRFSPDNKQLGVVFWNHDDKNGRVEIQGSDTQQVQQNLFFTTPAPTSSNSPHLTFSPDGKHICLNSFQDWAVYNLTNGQQIMRGRALPGFAEIAGRWKSGTVMEVTRQTSNRAAKTITRQQFLADISTQQLTPQGKPQTTSYASYSQQSTLSERSPDQRHELHWRMSSLGYENLELWTRQKKRLIQTLSDKYERAFFIDNNSFVASTKVSFSPQGQLKDTVKISVFRYSRPQEKWRVVQEYPLETNEWLRVHSKTHPLIATSKNGTLRLRDTRTWQVVQEVPGSSNDNINDMIYSSNEKYIAYTQSNQTRVQIFAVAKH